VPPAFFLLIASDRNTYLVAAHVIEGRLIMLNPSEDDLTFPPKRFQETYTIQASIEVIQGTDTIFSQVLLGLGVAPHIFPVSIVLKATLRRATRSGGHDLPAVTGPKTSG